MILLPRDTEPILGSWLPQFAFPRFPQVPICLPIGVGGGGGAGLVFPTAPAGIRALAGGFVVGRARHCITEVLKAGEVGFLGERRGNGRGIHWTFLLVFTDISTKYTRVD